MRNEELGVYSHARLEAWTHRELAGHFLAITNRTEADVARVEYLSRLWTEDGFVGTAEDLDEWLNGENIGAYNAGDLNRVGRIVAYIAKKLIGYGYAVEVTPKTDWAEEDIPTASRLEQYLANVAAIRDAIIQPDTTPAVPERMSASGPGEEDGLNWERANNIEKILVLTDQGLTQIQLGWVYSGEIYAGEAFL